MSALLLSLTTSAHAQNFWAPIGLAGTQTTCLAAGSDETVFAGTVSSGLHRSTDQGASWTQVFTTDQNITALVIHPKGSVFAGYGGFNGVIRSKDNGATWTTSSPQHGQVNGLYVTAAGTIWAGATEAASSDDEGDSWVDLVWFKKPRTIRAITTNLVNHVTVLTDYSGGSVMINTDNSNHWDEVVFGHPCRSIGITSKGVFFIASDSGMHRSFNNTYAWEPCNSGLTSLKLTCMVVTRNDEIFVGSLGGGVFHSTNGGNTWSAINAGLTDMDVQSMAISPAGILYIGTKSGGIFRSTVTTTAVQTADAARPADFVLLQNHPNPFTPSTTVTFTLPARAFTSIDVTDAFGRIVARLADGEFAAGVHAREWNAGGLPSGTYFCRLRSGAHTAVRTLILQK